MLWSVPVRIYRFAKTNLKRNSHGLCGELIMLFDSHPTPESTNISFNMKITLPVTDGVTLVTDRHFSLSHKQLKFPQKSVKWLSRSYRAILAYLLMECFLTQISSVHDSWQRLSYTTLWGLHLPFPLLRGLSMSAGQAALPICSYAGG